MFKYFHSELQNGLLQKILLHRSLMHISVDAFRVLHWANGSAFLVKRQNNTKPMGNTFPLNSIRLQWVYYRKFKIYSWGYVYDRTQTIRFYEDERKKEERRKEDAPRLEIYNVKFWSAFIRLLCFFFSLVGCNFIRSWMIIKYFVMNFLRQICAFIHHEKLKSDV